MSKEHTLKFNSRRSLHSTFDVRRSMFDIHLLFALLSLCCLPATCFAVSETDLHSKLETDILPFFTSQLRFGAFHGQGDVPIHYAFFDTADEKGALVITTGRQESIAKYAEVLFDLKDSGFDIYIMDHRGQGFSGRMLNDPRKGHVADFENYVADLQTFVDSVVKKTPYAGTFYLSHSIGCTIGILYAARFPDTFDGLILVSPFFEINTGLVPQWIVRGVVELFSMVGLDESFVPGGGSYTTDIPFDDNIVTTSKKRYELTKKLVDLYPETALFGPTNRWVAEASAAGGKALDAASSLPRPILLLQAADDKVIRVSPQEEFCRKSEKCTLRKMPEAGHEILMERDSIRNQAFMHIRNFLQTRTGMKGVEAAGKRGKE